MTPTPLQQAAAQELLRQEDALDSLSRLREYIAPTGHVDFQHPPATHHDLIIYHLERLERGEINKLLILAPPGSAKSTYCSIQYPMWRLARAPHTNILCASNTMTLAEEFNRRRRLVAMTPDWARLSETGPELVKEGVEHFVTTKQGGIRAAGVGSGIVGFRSQLNILDDPIASLEEALSPAALDKQWAWFINEFRTRLVPGAPELIVSTRWAKKDIAGRILDLVKAGTEDWTVLRLPMLADRQDDPLGRAEGEPLWPDYFTRAHIREKQQDPLMWSTQFQQTPLDESGSWVDRQSVIYTDSPPLGEPHCVIAIDLALSVGKGDFTVFAVGRVDCDRRLHIVHVDRSRIGPDESVDKLFELAWLYQPLQVIADDDNATKVFRIAVHERMRKGVRGLTPFALELLPMRGKDKETRAAPIRAMFLRGDVRILRAGWTATLVSELLEFPAGDHDDQVDALGLIGRRFPMLSAPSKPPVARDPYEGMLLRPTIMPDGTQRLAMQIGLHQMFEDRERRLRRVRGRI
jgi:predicted phage terminase large subunit-like protein